MSCLGHLPVAASFPRAPAAAAPRDKPLRRRAKKEGAPRTHAERIACVETRRAKRHRPAHTPRLSATSRLEPYIRESHLVCFTIFMLEHPEK